MTTRWSRGMSTFMDWAIVFSRSADADAPGGVEVVLGDGVGGDGVREVGGARGDVDDDAPGPWLGGRWLRHGDSSLRIACW